MVITDYLTGLYSRNYLEQRLAKGDGGVFILLDIDDFKQMNDTYGHQVGDNLLIQAADIKKMASEMRILEQDGRGGISYFLPVVKKEAGIAVAKQLVEKVNHMTNQGGTIS